MSLVLSTYAWCYSSYCIAILHLLKVTSLASRTADNGYFIDSYTKNKTSLANSRVTYKIVHFVKGNHNFFIVDFVNDTFDAATLASFAISIALVEAYDITR